MILTGAALATAVKEGAVIRPRHSVVYSELTVDLHLKGSFLEYAEVPEQAIEPPASLKTRVVNLRDGYLLTPGASVLAASQERLVLPKHLAGWIYGKSSLARGHLNVIFGHVDPGYSGRLTLMLVNNGSLYYRLRPGLAVAQLALLRLDPPVEKGYSGRFHPEDAPTGMQDR